MNGNEDMKEMIEQVKDSTNKLLEIKKKFDVQTTVVFILLAVQIVILLYIVQLL